MGKSFVKCPKDPKIQYYREVCTEFFEKEVFAGGVSTVKSFRIGRNLLVTHSISIY
jgi:hypothetical protein